MQRELRSWCEVSWMLGWKANPSSDSSDQGLLLSPKIIPEAKRQGKRQQKPEQRRCCRLCLIEDWHCQMEVPTTQQPEPGNGVYADFNAKWNSNKRTLQLIHRLLFMVSFCNIFTLFIAPSQEEDEHEARSWCGRWTKVSSLVSASRNSAGPSAFHLLNFPKWKQWFVEQLRLVA